MRIRSKLKLDPPDLTFSLSSLFGPLAVRRLGRRCVCERERGSAGLRLADCFVLPSEGAGFGLVLRKSLACGTTVIASNVDGGREAVAGGRFGMLVDPTNDSELIDVIQTSPSPPPASAVRNHFGPARYQTRVHRTPSTILHEGKVAA